MASNTQADNVLQLGADRMFARSAAKEIEDGKAVVDGILTALDMGVEFIVMDADFSHAPETIPEMVTPARLQFPEARERERATLALRTLYES